MSLSRLALRLATVEALSPSAASAAGPWPTLAGKFVFDSKLDPIDDFAAKNRRPLIVVYTETDKRDGSQKAGGPPYKQTVELVLMLSVMGFERVGETDELRAFYPETDAEIEASLDLLEWQALFAMHYGPSGKIWRDLTGRKVSDIVSERAATGEEAFKLAMREVRLTVQVAGDCVDAAPAAAPDGLARLPQPLRGVVEALGETSPGRAIAAALAPSAPAMPVPARLDIFAGHVDISDPQGNHDGVADVEFESRNLQD